MKLKFIIFLCMIFNFTLVHCIPIKWVDRIIMIVNDDVITERDLNDMIFNIKKQIPKNAKITTKELTEAAMQRLFEEKLLVQFAKNKGLTISEKEIDNQIKSIADSRKISVSSLYELIKKEGVDRKSLRNTISNNLIVSKILNEFLPATTPATTQEINTLLEKNNIPITPENKEQAALLISREKSQQSYVDLIENLRSSAYIKFNDKPY